MVAATFPYLKVASSLRNLRTRHVVLEKKKNKTNVEFKNAMKLLGHDKHATQVRLSALAGTRKFPKARCVRYNITANICPVPFGPDANREPPAEKHCAREQTFTGLRLQLRNSWPASETGPTDNDVCKLCQQQRSDSQINLRLSHRSLNSTIAPSSSRNEA
jgi:hypothetical protein